MPTFEGCVEAKEISLTRKGANQHAHVLIRKNLDGGVAASQTQTENTTMATEAEKAAQQAEISKAAMAIVAKTMVWNDVTKSYFAALPADKHDAFMAKSADEQKVEAETAKKAEDERIAAEKAAAEGKTVEMVALEKRLSDQQVELDVLKSERAEREIEKRAANEFAGYPGGTAVVVPLLKAFSKLPEAERIAAENVLKAQATTAGASLLSLGGRSEESINKAATGKARIEAEAKKRADASGGTLSYADAYEKVTEDPAFAADVEAVG